MIRIKSKESGMSILEMAIVITIMSGVGAAMIMNYGEQNTHAKWKESDAKLAVVKKALVSYANKNKYLPCPSDGSGDEIRTDEKGSIPELLSIPASPYVPATATSPAIPASTAIFDQVAITDIDVNVCAFDNGEVPFSVLGLSAADVQDSWGNPFAYAVDQGVTNADLMIDCPTQTACFFNQDALPLKMSRANSDITNQYKALPWFNLATEPTKESLGANNLTIYSGVDAAGAFMPEEATGQIAVLVAFNENGTEEILALDAQEAQNRDGDLNYVNSRYQTQPDGAEYFDDLVLGISANDIKRRFENESHENVVINDLPNQKILNGSDKLKGGKRKKGKKGSGHANDDATKYMDKDTQHFDFGSVFAGNTVVLTLDTRAQGTWDFFGADDKRTDKFYIDVNDVNIHEQFNRRKERDGGKGRKMYWEDSHEFLVELDKDGKLKLDLIVGTTSAKDETVDFTNIKVSLYDHPGSIPDLPSVTGISGIPQTFGL